MECMFSHEVMQANNVRLMVKVMARVTSHPEITVILERRNSWLSHHRKALHSRAESRVSICAPTSKASKRNCTPV